MLFLWLYTLGVKMKSLVCSLFTLTATVVSSGQPSFLSHVELYSARYGAKHVRETKTAGKLETFYPSDWHIIQPDDHCYTYCMLQCGINNDLLVILPLCYIVPWVTWHEGNELPCPVRYSTVMIILLSSCP